MSTWDPDFLVMFGEEKEEGEKSPSITVLKRTVATGHMSVAFPYLPYCPTLLDYMNASKSRGKTCEERYVVCRHKQVFYLKVNQS